MRAAHDSESGSSLPHSILREFGRSVASLVFPGVCALCGCELTEAFAARVCRACWASIAPWTGPECARCGEPLASAQALDSATALCGTCRRGEFQFDRARSYGLYAGRLRDVILQLKFHGAERLGPGLGALLLAPWERAQLEIPVEGGLVIPVPLHRSRQRQRGFNQAELLARGFCRALRDSRAGCRVEFEQRALQRRRPTRPQAGLTVRGRHENVRGVFTVAHAERVLDRDVFLIDDVMTTGATVSACARELKRAGARRVVVLTAARATPQFPDGASGGRTVAVDDSGGEQT